MCIRDRYANRREDTQDVLKPLALALLMQVARQYADDERADAAPVGTAELMVRYLGEHVDTVTLSALAARFSYHPNYVSTLLSAKLPPSPCSDFA